MGVEFDEINMQIVVRNVVSTLPGNSDKHIADVMTKAGQGLYGHSEVTCLFDVTFPIKKDGFTYPSEFGQQFRKSLEIDWSNPKIELKDCMTYWQDQDGGDVQKEHDLNYEDMKSAEKLAIQTAIDEITRS